MKKVVDGGGQGVDDSSEVELTEGEFGQGGLEAVLASGRKFKVVWRMLWTAVVWAGMAAMEGSHGSSV